MPRFSRIIAVLLVALVAATALCGQVIHMAQPPPSPQPVNYQCCLTRHYSALLQSSIFPRPSWTNLYHGSEIASGSSLLPIAHCPLPILSALSSSPPRTVSLRI